MRMRLGTTRGRSGLSVARRFAVIAVISAVPATPQCDLAVTMCMAWHLLFCERGLADSAGNTVRVGLRAASRASLMLIGRTHNGESLCGLN